MLDLLQWMLSGVVYSQGIVKNTLVRDLTTIEHLNLNQPESK